MKNLFLYIVILFYLFIIKNGHSQNGQLTIESNKQVYLTVEPVWIKVVMTNNGTETKELPEINIGNLHNSTLQITAVQNKSHLGQVLL